MIIGGGVVAGSVGMLCFYAAIKEAPLSRVMPIAFTAPLFGAAMGIFSGGNRCRFASSLGPLFVLGA